MSLNFRHFLAGSAVLGAAIVANSPAVASCVSCTSTQRCVVGNDGAYCGIWIIDGDSWCNFYDACSLGMLSPQDLSPSGTYLAEGAVKRGAREVIPCNGYVVKHASAPVPSEIRV